MSRTKIEHFAETHLGIKMTKMQVAMITAWSHGDSVTYARQMGKTTARDIAMKYLQDGVSQPTSSPKETP